MSVSMLEDDGLTTNRHSLGCFTETLNKQT
ncbi:hypothetical protein VPHD528_0209 [Vibrio phage D528]